MKIKKFFQNYFGLDDLIALLFLLFGVLSFIFPLKFRFLSGFQTSLIEIGITVLILGNASQYMAIKSEKNRLLLQMGSPINSFAIEAIRQMKNIGWLEDGTASGGKFVEADWSCAFLTGADLHYSNLIAVNLSDSDLSSANLIDTFLDLSNLSNACLMNTKLISAVLRGADLRNADLYETNFSNADLRDADLSTSHINNVILIDCTYNAETKWPPDFNPQAYGAILEN